MLTSPEDKYQRSQGPPAHGLKIDGLWQLCTFHCGPRSQRPVHFTHTYSVFLCLLVLVLLPPPFLSGHWHGVTSSHFHVITFFYVVSYVVGSDERPLVVQAELI